MKIIDFLKHIAKVILKREKISFISTKKYDFFDIKNIKNENQDKYKKIIGIDGIGFCGSSAITDYLAEFSNCTVFGGVDMKENPERGIENSYEIDCFRDPYGILDLEKICYTNVTRIRNKAIHDFLDLTINNYQSNCPIYDDFYLNETKIFLSKILNYSISIKKDYISYIPKNLTVKEYRYIAKTYISNFLGHIKSKDLLILDNIMSIGEPNSEILYDYFNDYKLIYVYCDPRDIYARARLSPGNDWVPKDPEIFVKFYLREFSLFLKNSDTNILCVSFDEFCNDYEKVSKEIMNFLSLSKADHINKFKYFDPKISINNTHVYNKIENQKAIEYIYENLREYCWDK